MSVTTEELLATIEDRDVRLVRFLWCGNDGIVRAKASSLHGLQARLRAGIGLTVPIQAMNSLDQLQVVDGMGPVGEVRLIPGWSIRVYGLERRIAKPERRHT